MPLFRLTAGYFFVYTIQMEATLAPHCPKCGTEVSETDIFCPHCGFELKPHAIDTSVAKQVLIYSVSFFLAPFGLHYAFTYLKQPDEKAKMIGVASLVLTAVAIAVAIIVTQQFFAQSYGQLDLINSATGF